MNARFTLRGWHVLAAMLLFFGTIIAVNVTFAVIAVRTFPGEDVRRSYVQGLEYNQTLKARRDQDTLGWQAGASLMADGQEAVLRVTLRDKAGAVINGADVTGALRWRADSRLDRALVFVASGDGVYEARLGALREGRWRLRARAEAHGGQVRDFEADLTWPTR